MRLLQDFRSAEHAQQLGAVALAELSHATLQQREEASASREAAPKSLRRDLASEVKEASRELSRFGDLRAAVREARPRAFVKVDSPTASSPGSPRAASPSSLERAASLLVSPLPAPLSPRCAATREVGASGAAVRAATGGLGLAAAAREAALC
ncbi:unnamed protein product, partial [Prorocentrum cordatum]